MIMLNLIGVFALKLKLFTRFSLFIAIQRANSEVSSIIIDHTTRIPKHRMSNTKKQRTEHGAVPGIGNNMNVVPQQLQHTKKAPEFELPVASIVRLVKRVRDYLFQSCCCF